MCTKTTFSRYPSDYLKISKYLFILALLRKVPVALFGCDKHRTTYNCTSTSIINILELKLVFSFNLLVCLCFLVPVSALNHSSHILLQSVWRCVCVSACLCVCASVRLRGCMSTVCLWVCASVCLCVCVLYVCVRAFTDLCLWCHNISNLSSLSVVLSRRAATASSLKCPVIFFFSIEISKSVSLWWLGSNIFRAVQKNHFFSAGDSSSKVYDHNLGNSNV